MTITIAIVLERNAFESLLSLQVTNDDLHSAYQALDGDLNRDNVRMAINSACFAFRAAFPKHQFATPALAQAQSLERPQALLLIEQTQSAVNQIQLAIVAELQSTPISPALEALPEQVYTNLINLRNWSDYRVRQEALNRLTVLLETAKGHRSLEDRTQAYVLIAQAGQCLHTDSAQALEFLHQACATLQVSLAVPEGRRLPQHDGNIQKHLDILRSFILTRSPEDIGYQARYVEQMLKQVLP